MLLHSGRMLLPFLYSTRPDASRTFIVVSIESYQSSKRIRAGEMTSLVSFSIALQATSMEVQTYCTP